MGRIHSWYSKGEHYKYKITSNNNDFQTEKADPLLDDVSNLLERLQLYGMPRIIGMMRSG